MRMSGQSVKDRTSEFQAVCDRLRKSQVFDLPCRGNVGVWFCACVELELELITSSSTTSAQ